jgi:hypothetical protein
VIGGARVRHPVRHCGGWGQRHRREGPGERLGIPPIDPGPPHGLGWRPREGKEPLLRWRRGQRRSRRWSGKEDQWGGWGEESRHPRMARATCGWCQSTSCRGMATESHLESRPGHPTCHIDHPCDRGCGHDRDLPSKPGGCRRAPGNGGAEVR